MLAEAATLLSPFSMQLLVKIFCICCMLCNSTSTDQWTIEMEPEKFNITTLGEVTINCTVKYPTPQKDKTNIQGFWKALGKGSLKINSKDTNKFIWHPNTSFVMQNFRGKTNFIGDISQGNCSLHMKDITESGEYYFRIETGSAEYSFKNQLFTIVGDCLLDVKSVTEDNEETPVEPTPNPEESTSFAVVLVSICVPVVLIFLASVVVVVFVFLLKRRNREVNLVRQTSDYYVNFQIPHTLQSTSSETKENIYKKQEPPLASKEEPIYTNVQGGPCVEPSVESDPKDNIYCNVDYDRQL